MTHTQESRTLIATFADYETAQRAARELQSSGVPADSVHVDANSDTGTSDAIKDQHHEGGFMGWWNSLFGSDDNDRDRSSYEGALAKGNTVVRATVPADAADASVDVLNRYGAIDVDEAAAGTDTTSMRGNTTATETDQRGPIQVVEEELQVGKRAVRRGGVRIYSHVVSQPVEQQVHLREEHVNVERRPVNRDISPSEVSALRDQTIEVTETAEEPVIAKRARVTEEVVVGKEATDRTETVRDTVRHTEVEVEQLGAERTDTRNRMGDTNFTNSGGTGDTQYANTGRSGASGATGLSPSKPSPGVLSGGASTAGAGTLAGGATAGSDWSTNNLTSDYRQDFERSYGPGGEYASMRPAYEWGSRYAGDNRYVGRSWDQIENDLRSNYERENPGSTWEQVKGAVRHGWEKVTGQR